MALARILAIAAVVASAALQLGSAQADRRLRSGFYEDTPFGSLAWVRNAKTRAAALSNLAIVDLTEQACIILPPSGIQWFMINHHDQELSGPGYFSIRILYRSDSPEGLVDGRGGLHVQRNGNWYGADGTVQGSYERDPDQIDLSEEEFISLHASSPDKAASSLEAIEREIGPWHMKPTKDAETSWTDRYLNGATLRAYLSAETSAISSRLIRFTPTASPSSREPLVFWLDPMGATSALILVDAPRHDYQGSRRVYDVKFGGTCP